MFTFSCLEHLEMLIMAQRQDDYILGASIIKQSVMLCNLVLLQPILDYRC